MLKYSVKLHRSLLCGFVAACCHTTSSIQARWWWSNTETCSSDIYEYFYV